MHRPATRGIDYLENECSECKLYFYLSIYLSIYHIYIYIYQAIYLSIYLVPANCEYIDQPGTYLPFTDTYVPDVEDIEGCRTECNSQSNYNCRSVEQIMK